jgi:hypothetical protein
MKPISHRTGKERPSGDNEVLSRGFPVVDSAYQALTLEGYRGECANARAPSFRSISNGYFKNEARQSFVSEAVFFALMIVTAAWPVAQSVRAMTDLVRAFGGF